MVRVLGRVRDRDRARVRARVSKHVRDREPLAARNVRIGGS